MVIGDGSSLFLFAVVIEIKQSKVYYSKLKNAGHTYGAVYYGKLEFTIVNFL